MVVVLYVHFYEKFITMKHIIQLASFAASVNNWKNLCHHYFDTMSFNVQKPHDAHFEIKLSIFTFIFENLHLSMLLSTSH